VARHVWLEVLAGVLAGAAAFMLIQGLNPLPLLLAGTLAGVFLVAPGLGPGMAARRLGRPAPTTSVEFADIGGQESAKRELKEALDFLREPEAVRRLGIRPLKGILLTGPPGTGKTLLAKAAARYTHCAFLAAAGSEFIEMYAGVGAQRVRELFARAREEARRAHLNGAIVFIDEMDVLGARRGGHQGHLEYDQTLNQLLVEMDGLGAEDDVRVLVVGATNRADLMDDALLRPGRFDRVVRVELPDREARRQILVLHTRGKPLAEDVDLDRVARETFGFSGAHLESLANEAAIAALRDGSPRIAQRHFLEAVDKVMLGERLDRRPPLEERRRVAVHEGGHALLAELRRPGSVAHITITSRGSALGYVRQAPNQGDRYLATEGELRDDIAVALAGSVAEEVLLGSRSTGARSDFQKVAAAARQMVLSGMSPLGVVDEEDLSPAARSEATTQIVQAVEQEVRQAVVNHEEGLRRLAEALVEEERLSGEELRALLGLQPLDQGGTGPGPVGREAEVGHDGGAAAGARGVGGDGGDHRTDCGLQRPLARPGADGPGG
jgi:cell division protease FtsH